MRKPKVLFLLLDGLGDRKYKELDNRTPLEYADKPTLDHLAEDGICGALTPAGLGKAVAIPDASLMLFSTLGYDVRKFRPKRGIVEAIALNIPMANGDLAARCNFATVDRNLRILDLRAGRIENTEILEQSLNAMKFEEPFIFKSATTYRAVLVLRSKNHNLSDRVSDIDPHGIGKRVKLATPLRKDAAYSAHLINSFLEKSHYLLEKHEFNKQRRRQSLPPANFLLLRGFGTQIPQLENFFDRFGLRACGISSIEVNVGILKMLGFDLTKVPEDIGNPDLELRAKIEPIENALADYDFVFAHFKTIDIPGHDGDLRRKIQEIERVDRFLGKLIPSLDTQNLTIVVTSDHGTSCYESGHSLDPIPTIVNGPKIAPERVKFGEQPCASTTLGRMPSYKLMEFVRERL